MNNWLLTVLLGIIEGLTEFLPVSSTAHLRLFLGVVDESLMSSGYWKMYTVVIQLGAILSVVVYFRNRIIGFLKSFPKGVNGDKTIFTHPLSLVMLAFLVTAIPSFLLSDLIKDNLESLWVMGGALIVGGVVMWVVDHIYGRREMRLRAARDAGEPEAGQMTWTMDEMKPWQAVVVGAVQILAAIFPGTSRSMSTIVGGQLSGMTRSAALEFSFFLSMPIMFAAGLYDLYKSLSAEPGDAAYVEVTMNGHYWGVLAVGFVVSFFVAWGVVHWFMGWVRKRGFAIFAVYRIVIGVIVLLWAARAFDQ